ncbi:MAG: hypothetical protein K2I81_02065 [Alphaproteobacteria bacterium]|nr:hypothetical protein [Alphaproteobacteria bacterium]
MKKVVAWIFAFVFTVPAAVADTPVISRAIPSSAASADTSSGRDSSSATTARTTVRRDVSSAGTTVTGGGADAARSARTVAPSRSTASRNAAVSTSARDNLNDAVSTVGRNARVTAASVNSDPAVRRAGVTLRPSTAEVGGRAKIAGTDIQTGSNIGESVRALQSRSASSTTTSVATQRETIAEAKERLEQTADLNKSCQEQYNDCMDQFCAVVDANQKRCSCSANLSRYTKVETAVKEANTQLNDVAQRIRYVGLSADEIRAIMSATEAEEALSGARDTSETRNMLADIEEMIKNPSSSASAAGTDNFSTLDLNLDFSDTSNLFSLDFLNNNSSSMSNLRGTDLYNAAKKRCNTILTQCKDAGATQQQLTANYDLAIDKDCIAYEQGLTKMNETLVSNVRSANLMLQKARLAVLQNKNQYDAKGCIAALDTCMTDEMVCGENYEKCLDPTKKYIDENGNVVIGQDITDIRDFMKSYDNSSIDTNFLRDAAATGKVVSTEACKQNIKGEKDDANGDGWCAVRYLLQKIGTGVRSTEGLCRPVLDKCQRYTYDSNNTYLPYNDIVLNYIQRAMVNIKSGQEKTIADYAANCMVDVATCYNQQVTQVNAWTTSASVSSIKNVMRGACRNVVLTCGYAIFDDCSKGDCPDSNDKDAIIDKVSDMFYNSMLCPDNSTYTETAKSTAEETEKNLYVNDLCKCNTGYEPLSGQCVTKCPEHSSQRNAYGTCVCDEGYTLKNGLCVANESS